MANNLFGVCDYNNLVNAISNNPMLLDENPLLQNNASLVSCAVRNGYPYQKVNPALQLEDSVITAAAQAILSNIAPRVSCESEHRAPMIRIGHYIDLEMKKNIFKVLQKYQNKEVCLYQLPCNIRMPFIRDIKVIRPDGCHSIPFANPVSSALNINVSEERLVLAVMPAYLKLPFIQGDQFDAIMGNGGEALSNHALVTAHQEGANISIQKGLIEGGNCIFFKKNEVDYAIVGETSIYISWLNLLKINFFASLTVPDSMEPSEDSYNAIKNTFENIMKLKWIYFVKNIKNPCSEDLKPELKNEAIKFEEEIRRTKMVIAEDLGIPLENIIFVPQRNFHIDLEMSVNPSGEVLLHDPREAVKTIEELANNKKNSEAEEALLQDCLQQAKREVELYSTIVEMTKQKLEAAGLIVKPLPLSFISEKNSIHLNYANGIFEARKSRVQPVAPKKRKTKQEWVFFTTGPSIESEKLLHNHVVKLLTEEMSNTKVITIKKMSEMIFNKSGGLRCLSLIG